MAIRRCASGAGPRTAIGAPSRVAEPPPGSAGIDERLVGPVLGRVEHHAGDDLAVDLGRDRDRELQQPVEEVDGAVDRVDDPAHAARAGDVVALLAEHGVVGPRREEPGPDQLLRRPVGQGDDVDVAGLGGRDVDPAGAVLTDQDGRFPGDGQRQVGELLRAWRHASGSAGGSSAPGRPRSAAPARARAAPRRTAGRDRPCRPAGPRCRASRRWPAPPCRGRRRPPCGRRRTRPGSAPRRRRRRPRAPRAGR